MFGRDITNLYHALATGNTTPYISQIMQSDWMEWTKYDIIILLVPFRK